VGRALERLTGLPLFHNHMTIDLVLPFFEFGSAPFTKLVRSFRKQIFEEVAASQLPGLIFTAFNDPRDEEFVRTLKKRFESRGGRAVFVELWADLSTRLERNRTELRLLEKPSKRDLEESDARVRQAEETFRMRSDGGFPFPPSQHLLIDNTRLEPDEVARRIAEHFRL
jgi:hypothetical protein